MKKIMLVLIVLIITGCGHVTPPEYEMATELCKNNGGIYFVQPNLTSGATVICHNGMKVDFRMPTRKEK